MDTTSTIIGLVLLAIIILPFAILTRKSKAIEKKRKLALAEFAKEQNCMLTKQETDGDISIGIDEKQNKLFFLSYYKDTPLMQFIDLAQIEACSVVKTIKEGMKDNGDSYSIASLAINFNPREKHIKQETMEFFNAQKKIQLGTEYVLLREWLKIINDQLKLIKQ